MKDAIQESRRIISEARERGVTLRLIGGLAFRQHCNELAFCEREYGDIDLVGLSHESSRIINTLTALGYKENITYTLASGGNRLLFEKPDSQDHVDIFLDKLRMEHDITLRHRLDIEEFTISVSDLLICKLIIMNLNEKDYRDIITIVKDLTLGEVDAPSVINTKYLAKICSSRWGLYYDVIASLDKCIKFLDYYQLDEVVAREVLKRLALIKQRIVDHPKSLRWKLRNHVGKRLQWRKIVELEHIAR
ncbi:MAG: hypothetical protein JW779_14630 [Candidatus Thorarchaeota archaeon]|nr:hypothetical protein [Candidatus Thorarchaeota archaeon]